jgi:hypothetical protein
MLDALAAIGSVLQRRSSRIELDALTAGASP